MTIPFEVTLLRSCIRSTLIFSIVFALLTGAAIFVGFQQPSSEWVIFLHLNECELPCWIGIEPGKTTFAEARQKIMNTYQNTSLYQLSARGDNGYIIAYKETTKLAGVYLFSTAEKELPDSIVNTINFLVGSDTDEPTIAELYDQLGAAEAVEGLPLDTPTQGLYFQAKKVEAFIDADGLVCNEVLPAQRVKMIILSASALALSVQEYNAPPQWRGFYRCNN